MRASSAFQCSNKLATVPRGRGEGGGGGGGGGAFSLTWSRINFPQRPSLFRVKCAPEFGVNGLHNVRTVPMTVMTAEKEEAKAILNLFLKKHGLSNAAANRIINKSEMFVDHLISKLLSVHKSWYLVGKELSTPEIRDVLIPYLESLLEEHGRSLVNVIENFPNLPGKERITVPLELDSVDPALSYEKMKAISRVSEIGSNGQLPPHILYLLGIGMDIDQIKGITRKFPAFADYSLEGKIKPIVEFLVDLGIPLSNIPTLLNKRPQLCGISLTENIIPTMAYLESFGIEKKMWAKVIVRFPAILTYSRQKVKVTVDYLYEMGLSAANVGKVLTRAPQIISYSVDDKLRPTTQYFHSMGVDVSVLFYRTPQIFGLNIETNLKPVTEFFLERDYSIEEIAIMVSRHGALYTFSLTENLIPKWDFFLTMQYPKTELIKFPQYFGYSLEERIKPRYSLVMQAGVRLLLNQVLSYSDTEFQKVLDRKVKKMLSSKDAYRHSI